MPKLRAYGALIAVVLVTLPLSNYFQGFWVSARINESERTWGWWSPRWLALTWGWEVLVAVVAALGLALLLPRGSRFRWYVGLGVVYALVRFLIEGGLASGNSEVGFAAWRYGSYLMTIVGAGLGGCIALARAAWRRRLTILGGGRDAYAVGRRARTSRRCHRGPHPSYSAGRATCPVPDCLVAITWIG